MDITFEKNNDICICKISGEIDLYNASDMKQAISEKIDNENILKMVIDFQEILYIDSSAIGALIALMSKIGQMEGQLFLTNINEAIQEIFELTKLTSFFNIKKDLQEAFDSFKV